MGFLDINRVSEDVLVPLFAEVYGYAHLKNLNADGESYPGIDLGDKIARVAFQVTSERSSQKIKKTLETFVQQKHYKQYRHLVIYIITEKQGSYTGSGWNKITGRKFTFDKERDIRDSSDLLKAIRHLPIEKVQRVEALLEQHFSESTKIPVRDLLNSHLLRQLAKEKHSKKYIPDIFVEVATAKDQARYFVHPVLFFQKIHDEVRHLNFDDINRILQKLSLMPMRLPSQLETSSDEEVEDVYRHIGLAREALSKIRNDMLPYSFPWRAGSPFDITNVPLQKRYVFEDMQYKLGEYVSSVMWDIDDLIRNLEMMSSRVLFVIARAGQGKTNFVCNFAETVLMKRSIPCLFFAGRDLNHVAPERIGDYFAKSIFGDRVNGLDEALDALSALGASSNVPVIIIIDGISEHTDIQAFSHHLEKFVENVLAHKHIKLILTCRSEYFEERFKNFKQSSFAEEIQFIDNLERQMSETHKDQLVKGYFRFFKLHYPYISKCASEVLENDVLLLRMFCEAYGNVDARKETEIAPIVDIYRDKVFREYLERKVQAAAVYDKDASRIRVGPEVKYLQVLARIINLMIRRGQYSDIPISGLPQKDYEALGALLGEDIIIRKDLVSADNAFGDHVEVINFTFDEFRDFLLAKHLSTEVFRRDQRKFEELIDRMVSPTSRVAEGVRTYLFFASKHPTGQDILKVIGEKEWYKEIFIKSIFSVEEELITQNDLNQIKARFFENVRNASWVIKMLVWRWRSSLYSHLNINLLFEILGELDQDTYNKLVRPSVSDGGVYGFDGAYSWKLDDLVKDLEEALEDKDLLENPDFGNMMELMIYFFPIWGERTYSSPAFDMFERFALLKPVEAIILLRKHTRITHLGTCTGVWRMLTRILKIAEIPNELIEEACGILLGFGASGEPGTDTRSKEIVRFLETCAIKKRIWYKDPVVEQMKRHTLFPFVYEQNNDTGN